MQTRTPPSAAATPQSTNSRDLAVAAIKEALEMIGEADRGLDQPKIRGNEKYDPSNARFARLVKNWQRTRITSGMLVGLLALVFIGVAAMAWLLKGGQAAPEPIVTSSVPTRTKEELPGRPSPNNSRVAATTQAEPQESRAQLLPQNVAGAPAVVPMPAELARQIQEISHELANVEQGIGQLKAEQSQVTGESAGLAELLKQTRELAGHNTELNENLKATQAQIAHEIRNLTDQLKANQDFMNTLAGQLKENQEQIARLVASEQKPRPRPLPASPAANLPSAPVANLVRRAAPKPPTPTGGTQARDPARSQPAQQ